MSQLHFYVPDELESKIRLKAKQASLPLSKYLAEVVKRDVVEMNQWPEGYLDLFDEWHGEPQDAIIDLQPEQRLGFD